MIPGLETKIPHAARRLVIISITGEMDVTGDRCSGGFYCVGNVLSLKLSDVGHIRVLILLLLIPFM